VVDLGTDECFVLTSQTLRTVLPDLSGEGREILFHILVS